MGTTFIIGIYIACELIANVTASKPVTVLGMDAPGGVFIYAITFTLVDLINERLGKQGARHVIYTAVAANILLAFYSILIVELPSPAFFTQADAFRAVLGATPRIVAASLIAYLVSSLIDVEVFDAWKRRVHGHRWARVLVSNTVSTGIDSAVFVLVAFGGVLPVLPLIAGQYAIKMAVTIISIPLIYVTRSGLTARS